MSRLFGTDGIRGVAGVDVTPALAQLLGSAARRVLAGAVADPIVVVGRDPRPSGPGLFGGLGAGLRLAGADVIDLGVIPTPAVAHAVAAGLPWLDSLPSFGVVISASHNPSTDNGIKLFGPGGGKLSLEAEDEIEAEMTRLRDHPRRLPVAVPRDDVDRSWYVEHLLAAVAHPLDGQRIVVDCANGAAAVVARAVYEGAGAEVVLINDDLTEGVINDNCGATHLDGLRGRVIAERADVGIAHDGDADRCLAVDSAGHVVDGDAIMAVLALDLSARNSLRGNAIAATVMSNQGLVAGLAAHGIDVVRTDVGDRAVLERIIADDLSLGGEQSGHIVLREFATTGDGLLTALALLSCVASSGRSLRDLASVVRPMPQVLINVVVDDRAAAAERAAATIAEVQADLGDSGRVLVRPSGTEPLLRVMVEAFDADAARDSAERIVAAARL